MAINGDMFAMILKMLGVKELSIETDTPDAVITLHFTRYGQTHQSKYTLKDLIESIHSDPPERRPAPGDYTDIRDIPSSG